MVTYIRKKRSLNNQENNNDITQQGTSIDNKEMQLPLENNNEKTRNNITVFFF